MKKTLTIYQISSRFIDHFWRQLKTVVNKNVAVHDPLFTHFYMWFFKLIKLYQIVIEI